MDFDAGSGGAADGGDLDGGEAVEGEEDELVDDGGEVGAEEEDVEVARAEGVDLLRGVWGGA